MDQKSSYVYLLYPSKYLHAGESIVCIGRSSTSVPKPRRGLVLFSAIVADGAEWERSVKHELVKRFGARQDLGPDHFQGKVPHIRDCVVSMTLKHPMGDPHPLIETARPDAADKEGRARDAEKDIEHFLDSHLEPADAHEFVTLEQARRLYLSRPGNSPHDADGGIAATFKRTMMRKLGAAACVPQLSYNGTSYRNAFQGYRLVDKESRDAVMSWLASRTQVTDRKEDAVSLEHLWDAWKSDQVSTVSDVNRSLFRKAYIEHFTGRPGTKYRLVSNLGAFKNARHVVRYCKMVSSQ